jgi:hypothetical protein
MPLIDPDKIGWSLTKIFAVEFVALAIIMTIIAVL